VILKNGKIMTMMEIDEAIQTNMTNQIETQLAAMEERHKTWAAFPHVSDDPDFLAHSRYDIPKLIKTLRRALEDNPDQFRNLAAAKLQRGDIAAILAGESE